VFKNVLGKMALAAAVVALAITSATQSPVHAQRTIEQAANALLNEVLTALNIQITNQELLLELSYELQYSLDTGIVDTDTVNELDIEVLNQELPDEELFEEGEDAPTEESTTSAPESTTAQLSDELKLILQNRLSLRLSAQVQYWEMIAEDWRAASELATREFTTCLNAATSDEESDICYFNEQQQLQFFYAQQLGDSFTTRLNTANQLGSDVVALLNQSMTRSRLTIQEALQFMNAEELGVLGFTPDALGGISQKLESHSNSSPSGGPTDSDPPKGPNQ
jgi:hypothetical protein